MCSISFHSADVSNAAKKFCRNRNNNSPGRIIFFQFSLKYHLFEDNDKAQSDIRSENFNHKKWYNMWASCKTTVCLKLSRRSKNILFQIASKQTPYIWLAAREVDFNV